MASLRTQCCSLALTALLTAPSVTFASETPIPIPEHLPARIVPAFKDGEPQGFKLIRIQKGSRLEALGLKDGDVVEQANGKPVREPVEMAALLQRIESGTRPVLTVLRGDTRQTLR